jgi:hypothetical protein
MTGPKHLYRKQFQHAYEAQETAKNFHLNPGIDRPGPVDVNVREEEGAFYVYVALEGDFDPHDVFDATGYERIA